jgi:hypothetical protein
MILQEIREEDATIGVYCSASAKCKVRKGKCSVRDLSKVLYVSAAGRYIRNNGKFIHMCGHLAEYVDIIPLAPWRLKNEDTGVCQSIWR